MAQAGKPEHRARRFRLRAKQPFARRSIHDFGQAWVGVALAHLVEIAAILVEVGQQLVGSRELGPGADDSAT